MDTESQDVRQVLKCPESTLYPVLRRLQKDDECLMVYDREFAGRNRRYYKITEKGSVQLQLYQQEWKSYSSKITKLLRGEQVNEQKRIYAAAEPVAGRYTGE